MKLPETVKVAKNYVAGSAGTLQYQKIEICPGKGEVALLLAYDIDLYCTPEQSCDVNAWVWRKSPPKTYPLIATRWQNDDDVIIRERQYHYWSTNVGYGRGGDNRYKILPYPVVLIRSPSLVVYTANVNGSVTGKFWYVLEKISDKQLAKLMVKDHD